MNWKKFVGDKAFYKRTFAVAAPIILQNAITNFVNLLDNVMVGQIGTEQMSGVSIVNNLMGVFQIAVFGVLGGTGIFTAQFFGRGDHKGVQHTMRFKLITSLLISILGYVIFSLYGDPLLNLYLNDAASSGDVHMTLEYGRTYLFWMFGGMLPFAITQVYAGTLRESGETKLPMKAGVVAVFVNLIGNYLLIFGNLGFPCLGVQGAAMATVLARVVEMGIVVVWTHCHQERNLFVQGLYRNFYIPGRLVLDILRKGWPLMINGGIWSAGIAIVTQSYSRRGLEVVAGLNISNTLLGLVNVVYMALGSVVGIIIGQLLGAGKMEEARDTDNKLIALAMVSCGVMGGLLALASPFFPMLYETTDEVRSIATRLMLISALFMPMHAFMHTSYFTLRSGGKTLITFLFDSGFLWCVTIPIVASASWYTQIPILGLYTIGQCSELLKCVVGYVLVKKGTWMQNIVDN